MNIFIAIFIILLLIVFILYFTHKTNKSSSSNSSYNKNTFVADPNISKFVTFCTMLKDRKYWEKTQESQAFLDDIQLLKQQNEDDRLYLGFAGEFSSGKSSLINSILHQNLLKDSDLQGTTCAPTFIRYDKSFDIVIDYKNGKKESYVKTCSDRTVLANMKNGKIDSLDFLSGPIRAFIDKYTATEEYSSQVDKVTIFINNPILHDGLVIVDTPGINANKRHSDVTRETLKKYCDAVILLIPTNASCSEILCTFVQENLSGLENRCIGIVSKIDSLRRPAEQTKLVEFVQEKISNSLEKPLAAVLPVSALYYQGKNVEDHKPLNSEQLQRYKDMFTKLEQTINDRLIKGRESILKMSLKKSLLESITNLQNNLTNFKNELKQRSEELNNNKLSDLTKWYEELSQEYLSNYNSIEYGIDLEKIYYNAVSYVRNAITQELNNSTSRADLKRIVNISLSSHCKTAQDMIGTQLQNIQSQYSAWADNSRNDFYQKFAAEYKKLFKNDVFSISDSDVSSNISVGVQNMNLSFGEEFIAKGAAYFIAGMIGGPIGIAIMALINLFVWNFNAAREGVRKKIEPILEEFSHKLWDQLNKTFDAIKNHSYSNAFTYTDLIVNEYEPVIKEAINKEKQKLNELQQQQKLIEQDLSQLHQFELTCTDF